MNLVDRARNIIINPKTEWPVVEGETPNTNQIITGYVIPLAMLPAIAAIIGWGFIGGPFVGRSLNYGIASALVSLIVAVVGVYISAFVIDMLAPSFASEKNLGRAMQLVAYSMTPVWVGGILNVLPMIGWLGTLFGLYGLYLLYLGLPHLMKTPQDKVPIYLIVSIVVLIIVYFILSAVLMTIFLGLFGISRLAGMAF
jgi:hypothetical protein